MPDKETSVDLHFPVAHIRTPTGYMNDPNGPVWYGDRLHMYFQYSPGTPPRSEDKVWGHCSSSDLVNWQLHGIALAPSDQRPGTEEIWSGNAVVHESHVVAFYSSQRDGDPYQPPHVTVSPDGGYSFGEDRSTVPPPGDREDVTVFRDPYVWHHGGGWRMIVGSGRTDGTAQVLMYESEDLVSWVARGPFAALRGFPETNDDLGSVWECPQYAWDLGVLFVAAWRPETGPISVQALKGAERDGRFLVESVERADHGPDYYAPSLMRATDGRYLLWGWIWEARDQQWRDEAGWAGMLSLPREVSLESGLLCVRPARELEALRQGRCRTRDAQSGEIAFDNVPRAFELSLRLEGHLPTGSLVLGFGEDEELFISLDASSGEVIVDREKASADPRADGGRHQVRPALGLLTDGALELRWFVDHSVSELFLAGGAVLTSRFYPLSVEPWRLRARAQGTTSITAQLWELRASVRSGADALDPSA